MRQVVTSTHSGARGLFSDWPDPAKDGRRVFLPDSDSRKALCDLIVSSSNLHIQSMKTMRSYLNEYLRADWDMITGMDISIIRACAEKTNKKKN